MTPSPLLPVRSLLGTVALAALLGCGGAAPAAGQSPAPGAPTPAAPELAPFAARRVALLPVQRLQPGDSLGWGRQLARPDSALRALDDSLSAALAERGLEGQWALTPQVVRLGRRNASFVHDPRRLTVSVLGAVRRTGDQVPEPLASQLRGLGAVADARFALVPTELHFLPAGGGTGRAVLRLALVDVRTSQLLWRGEVGSDPAAEFSPALASRLGERLADLILPR